MRHITRLSALCVLLLGTASFGYRPVVEAPQEVVVEGAIDGVAVGTIPTIIVNSGKVYLSANTVIKDHLRFLRPNDLRIGMKVTVYGFIAKGGVMARQIIVAPR